MRLYKHGEVAVVLYKSCYATVSIAQYCKLVSGVSIVGSIVKTAAVVSIVSNVSKVSNVNQC